MRVQQLGCQARTRQKPAPPHWLHPATLPQNSQFYLAARLRLLHEAKLAVEPLDCSCDGLVRHRQPATPLHLDSPAANHATVLSVVQAA
jgi:hypothetical protein